MRLDLLYLSIYLSRRRIASSRGHVSHRDAMRARWLAAPLIDDSTAVASPNRHHGVPARCAVPYPLFGRHHRTRAPQNRILVRARLHVCESGIRGRCGGADMCHSHVRITGMSLAGVYYIYHVNRNCTRCTSRPTQRHGHGCER